ncbi:MAG: hypothetical protein FD189_2591 [Elusimicrobia bacterium]|nr:MAG: hypothetical protein FD189_2591 [Elusimicrobiota bacterium]
MGTVVMSGEESKAGRAGVAARLAATGLGHEAGVNVNASRAVDGGNAIAATIGVLGLVVEAWRARG